MLVVDKSKEEGYFGEKQAIISKVFFSFYQLIFFVFVGVAAFAIATLHYQILLALIFISIIQMPMSRNQRYIDFVNRYIQPLKYFKHFEIIYEEIIPEENRCLFGIHPHSVFGLGLLASMNSSPTGQLSKMVGLSSRFILNFPIVGLLLKLWGLKAVDPNSLKSLMKEGKSIGLLPGGFEEATITSKDEMRCYINNRKGFIKYAIEHNYVVYPLLMLNQHQAFSTFQPWLQFRLFLNKLKFPGILFWNSSTGLFLPSSLSLHVIVGKGIHSKQYFKEGVSPSQEQIDQMHNRYIGQIQRMYSKYAHLNSDKPIKIY